MPAPGAMYLLDTGIVLGFQKAGHLDALTEASAMVPIAIVEKVYDEITDPRDGRHAKAASLAKRNIDDSRFAVRSIAVGSPASATFASLRIGKTNPTADLGEAA